MGLAVETLHPFYRKDWSGLSFPANVKAAEMAYKEAGITDPRKELDFGIVHDCFTITELINYQDMKLCKPGEGAQLIRDDVTAIDGDFPINPDGGLKCFGHPIGATGVRRSWNSRDRCSAGRKGSKLRAHRRDSPITSAVHRRSQWWVFVGRPDWKLGRR